MPCDTSINKTKFAFFFSSESGELFKRLEREQVNLFKNNVLMFMVFNMHKRLFSLVILSLFLTIFVFVVHT